MKRLIIIALTLVTVSPLFSQEKLIRLTYSIVDTTQARTDQARDIYRWITTNISYDTKQLKKGLKNYSPIQTIKRKKAVCSGYSALFHQMCNILDIESYIISGYSKGFNYIKGDHFIKADHTWNVIFADSNWIFVDPTWGSGHLDYSYTFKTRLKQRFIRNEGIKTKIIFIKDPNYGYFDTSFINFSSTHFPLDSKWQFSEYPVSYGTFLTDSIIKPPFLNFNWEISSLRNKGLEYQSFVDAINSIKYNPYNKFDIAYQYFYQAGQITINKKTIYDSTLLIKLRNSIDYYDSSSVYLKGFKAINQNLYKTKKNYQKSTYKNANNALKQIKKIPTKYNNRYSKAFYKLLNSERRLNTALQNTRMTNGALPDSILFSYNIPRSIDSSFYYDRLNRIEKDLLKIKVDFVELDGLTRNMDSIIVACIAKNDSIVKPLNEIKYFLQNIKYSIDLMDEFQVVNFCIKLSSGYRIYQENLSSKNFLQKQIMQNSKSIENKYESTERTLYSLFTSYKKLAELTGANHKFSSNVTFIIDKLRELYLQRIDIISLIQKNNNKWKELLNKQNDILSMFDSDGMPNIVNNLSSFYNYIANKNDKTYSTNLKLYEEINNGTRENKSLFKDILRQISKKQRLLHASVNRKATL